ncbi:MAG: hypothetical protein WD114_01430, partial [Phycisphaerales bacterium]
MPGPSGISRRTIGLAAAGVLALVFGAVIWFSITPAPNNGGGDPFPTDLSEIPNIEDAQTGGEMLITMVDRDDPTRVAATLRADRFEPIGEGRRRLDKPESWIYLRDGRAVLVTADVATMLMPDTSQPPESGTLEGNIVIRAYERSPAPGEDADPNAEPILIARFDEPVEFERRYLRLRSAGRFDIVSDQFDFSGADLTVILNDLRDRVELIDVVRGDRLVIHTDPGESPADRAGEIAEVDSAAGSADTGTRPRVGETVMVMGDEVGDEPVGEVIAEGEAAPDPVEQISPDTRYHVTLSERVVASVAGSGRASGDTLELWALMVDGRLPEDAMREIGFVSMADEQEALQEAGEPVWRPGALPDTGEAADIATENAPTGPDQPATTAPTDEGDELVITWAGRMTVRPMDNDVAQSGEDPLAEDDLALRLAADEGGGIAFESPERGFTGQAFETIYYATRGIVDMRGEQTESGIIRLDAAGSGSLVAGSLWADLADGTISIDGPGQITTAAASDNDSVEETTEPATIVWDDHAAFGFAMIEGALGDRLTDALFVGSVIAEQGGNSIGARELAAWMDPTLPPAVALSRLELVEGVLASENNSMLAGSDLTIGFEPGTDAPDPVSVVSIGRAVARTPEALLRSERMEAELMRDDAGEVVMRSATAEGEVRYTGADRTSAQADQLSADGVGESITLTGPGSSVAQGGSSITGEHIVLSARRRGIDVLGPGTFEHDVALENPDPNAPVTGHIRASWAGSMRFDDALGSIVCEEGVRVISTPDAYTRDTLEAGRAEIKLTPRPSSDPVAGARDRQLINARAFGRAQAGQQPAPASIESRTYSRADPELAISVLYLEGAQIVADNLRQTLTVPAPGTLLILDRSDEGEGDVGDEPIGGAGPG